jgi:hypothetical protein
MMISVGLRRAALAVFAALALMAAPAASSAQELAPEHLALARQYIDLTDKSNIYEFALIQVGVETMRTILTQNPDLQAPLDQAISKALDGYQERKGELLDQFARLYALRFSMEELQQIVDFYGTPVGQKLATANSNLNDDLQAVMKVFEANLRVEFFAKVRAEMKALGHDV